MKHECDNCGKPATVHLTEIVDGQKSEKHLCEDCAASEGITVKANLPISQLLEDFILQTASKEGSTEAKCEVCGLTFAEFRQRGVLGCPNDYDAFADALRPILQRAQGGAEQHIGRVPRRAATNQHKQTEALRLRAQLKTAVAAEDYEQAVRLRDRIRELEEV
jgi:protein arginine kinase activator